MSFDPPRLCRWVMCAWWALGACPALDLLDDDTAAAAAAKHSSSSLPQPGSFTPISHICSVFRSGAASPSRRYLTALSRRLGFPPQLPLLELDLEDGEASVLRKVDDARLAACEIDVLSVAANGKSDVLPARWANHPLRCVPSAPSAPRRLGVRARVRSLLPYPWRRNAARSVYVDAQCPKTHSVGCRRRSRTSRPRTRC
ncbi:hypothetical protein B0H16DRAFT_582062 [Mycena metata]|uniref:Uncharacterized protein n=1 Tax=Mycena metata TaxID=1033252 RepID=A0AAD7H4K1_9AGAR|nr:hypothetical protein B0H16DRAFT_582062 [Mycena metata]